MKDQAGWLQDEALATLEPQEILAFDEDDDDWEDEDIEEEDWDEDDWDEDDEDDEDWDEDDDDDWEDLDEEDDGITTRRRPPRPRWD